MYFFTSARKSIFSSAAERLQKSTNAFVDFLSSVDHREVGVLFDFVRGDALGGMSLDELSVRGEREFRVEMMDVYASAAQAEMASSKRKCPVVVNFASAPHVPCPFNFVVR